MNRPATHETTAESLAQHVALDALRTDLLAALNNHQELDDETKIRALTSLIGLLALRNGLQPKAVAELFAHTMQHHADILTAARIAREANEANTPPTKPEKE